MIYGIRFYRSSVEVDTSGDAPIFLHGRLDARRSDFDYIFACIYGLLEGYVYVDDHNGSVISCGRSKVHELYWLNALDRRQNESIMSARALYRFGRYVSDDWNLLVLFHPDAISNDDIVKLTNDLPYRRKEAFEHSDAARTILHNWDGIYWEIFAKDCEPIETLVSTHKTDAKLSMFKVDFRLDFPDPRNVSLEPVV